MTLGRVLLVVWPACAGCSVSLTTPSAESELISGTGDVVVNPGGIILSPADFDWESGCPVTSSGPADVTGFAFYFANARSMVASVECDIYTPTVFASEQRFPVPNGACALYMCDDSCTLFAQLTAGTLQVNNQVEAGRTTIEIDLDTTVSQPNPGLSVTPLPSATVQTSMTGAVVCRTN